MDGEEMKNNSNHFDYKHYVSEKEYDIENPPFCFCGRVAKRRMSRAAKNPGRWFFNCANKNFNTEDMVETDNEEVDSNYLEHEDEEMVSGEEEKSVLSYEVSTTSVQPDQFKEMNLFPQYPDLDLLVQEHKPHIGLDGSILSLAPPGSPPV
ncbi:hypothetical protein LIER_41054 [Lithospermum erythrorhizon]|uniref:Zinc finger GRF-type domain-containing protein n=1 Tax=Lithospermum erythrorhizon TaxID=34254 RepID=A0AAV3R3N4_LITER